MNLFPGVLLLLVALAARAADWNIADHIPLERVVLQAHRGAGFLAEENTIEAFELGWSLRCQPEADVRTTKDGVIVAFHDANFDRVVKNLPAHLKGKGVQHVTWHQLTHLDVGAWKGEQFKGRRVSKLSEVFAVMTGRPDRHLYLDIKQVDFKKLAEEVRTAGVQKQVTLASPKPEQIAEWKKLIPESDTLLWMRGAESELGKRLEDLRAKSFEGITQLQIHIFPAETGANRFTLSDKFIRDLGNELRARGILFQSLPYTADTKAYGQLLDLGMMSFATDYPEVTWAELKAYYEGRAKK